MQTSGSSPLPSDWSAFLYADICVQPNGMPLTVLSLLGRLGIDPWAEAQRLAALPSNLAVSALCRSITTALSDPRTRSAPCAQSEARAIAVRLVSLLPQAKPVRVAWTWHNWADGAVKA